MEVIFVSSDRTQSDMMDYMRESHADWLAVPFGSPGAQALSSQFGVRGIPALKVVGRDGSIISAEGREEVMAMGESQSVGYERLDLGIFRSCCFCPVGDVGTSRG